MAINVTKPAINLREKLNEVTLETGIKGEELLNSDTSTEARNVLELDTHLFTDFESTGIDDNATSTAITIDASENVGIGTTTTPGAKLHVENAAAAAELWLQRTGYTAVKLYGSTLGDGNGFKINVGGADRLNIDSSGNVGLGADPSAARFNIESASECAHFDRTDADGTLIRFRRSGFTKGSITISGSTTAYNTSSDYRLKENIVPMTGSIDRLKNLNPSKFNFIGTSNVVDGFLAHEAGEVVPEAIYGTKDAMTAEVLYTAEDELPEGMNIGDVKEASAPDYQGIDQSKLVPLLVSALQEAIARIEVLENA